MPTLTDQRQSFLDAIIAEPDADDLRLVFADWLEDNGEPEYGSFIRVQCELAELTEGVTGGDLDWQARVEALSRRERELLALPHDHIVTNRTAWSENVRHLVEQATFRRGFVAEITCRCEDWVGRACEACNTTGRGSAVWPPHAGDCLRCHGSGRTGAHGPSLVRACPLERVTLSNVQPLLLYGGDWIWLTGCVIIDEQRQVYPTRKAAEDAASQRLLAWARPSPIARP